MLTSKIERITKVTFSAPSDHKGLLKSSIFNTPPKKKIQPTDILQQLIWDSVMYECTINHNMLYGDG